MLDKTKEWQNLVLASNLPYWLKLKLINSVFPMVTNTIYTQDKRFARFRPTAYTSPSVCPSVFPDP